MKGGNKNKNENDNKIRIKIKIRYWNKNVNKNKNESKSKRKISYLYENFSSLNSNPDPRIDRADKFKRSESSYKGVKEWVKWNK